LGTYNERERKRKGMGEEKEWLKLKLDSGALRSALCALQQH